MEIECLGIVSYHNIRHLTHTTAGTDLFMVRFTEGPCLAGPLDMGPIGLCVNQTLLLQSIENIQSALELMAA